MQSTEAVVDVIERIKREYITALFLLGVPSTEALKGQRALIIEQF
jgi:isopentenyl-diphosphate delta-isomerase